jgi:hypothetical protein
MPPWPTELPQALPTLKSAAIKLHTIMYLIACRRHVDQADIVLKVSGHHPCSIKQALSACLA